MILDDFTRADTELGKGWADLAAASVRADQIHSVRRRDYAQGVIHGFRTTLELLLGGPADGGRPCPGPIPEHVRRWAQDALDRVAADEHVL